MERKLTKITLPRTKADVWIKDELTIGEERKASESILKDMKIDLAKAKAGESSSIMNEMPALNAIKATDETMIVSIAKIVQDGKDITPSVEWINGLYKDDYLAIESAMKISKGKEEEDKKKS
jgi:hypothetical protein